MIHRLNELTIWGCWSVLAIAVNAGMIAFSWNYTHEGATIPSLVQFAPLPTTVLQRTSSGDASEPFEIPILLEPPPDRPIDVTIRQSGTVELDRDVELSVAGVDVPIASSEFRVAVKRNDNRVVLLLTLLPSLDATTEQDLILEIAERSDDYLVGGNRRVQLRILPIEPPSQPEPSDPVPRFFFAGGSSKIEQSAAGGPQRSHSIRISANPAPRKRTTVNVEVSGSAKPSIDYRFAKSSRTSNRNLTVQFGPRQASATISLDVLPAQSNSQGGQVELLLALSDGSAYDAGSPREHTVAILRPRRTTEPPPPKPTKAKIVVQADSEVAEGNAITYRATVTEGKLAETVVIRPQIVADSEARPGDIFVGDKRTFQLEPGDTEDALQITAVNDDTLEGPEDLVLNFALDSKQDVDLATTEVRTKITEPAVTGDVLLLVAAASDISNANVGRLAEILKTVHESKDGARIMGNAASGSHVVYFVAPSHVNAQAAVPGQRSTVHLPRSWSLDKLPGDARWDFNKMHVDDLRNAARDAVVSLSELAMNRDFKTLVLLVSNQPPGELENANTTPIRQLAELPDGRDVLFFWLYEDASRPGSSGNFVGLDESLKEDIAIRIRLAIRQKLGVR